MGPTLTIVAVVMLLAAVATAFAKIPVKVPDPDATPDPYGSGSGSTEATRTEYRRVPALPVGLAVTALLLLLLASMTMVAAKNYGVVRTFGAVSDDTLDPGLHLKAPWQQVTDIDTTIQPDEYQGDNCVKVQLGDGGAACVYVTNRWEPVGDKANVIYQDYRSDDPTETLQDNVSTQFKAAVNEVFGDYDPLTEVAGLDLTDPKTVNSFDFTPDYSALSDEVEQAMNAKMAEFDGVGNVRDVTISYIDFGDGTQGRIDDFIKAVGETRVALQQQARNEAQARANDILADSLRDDPLVLVNKCLDAIADGFVPPAGFSCWPGAGSAVVLPAPTAPTPTPTP